MMLKKTIKDINLIRKRVLVRVDYNVSLTTNLRLADDYRIKQTLPTLKYLLDHHCSIFLLSHLGRPGGKREDRYSLKPVVQHLKTLLNQQVHFFSKDYLDPVCQEELKHNPPGQVTLLENIRFYPQEEKNDLEFAKKLASLGEVFVNDAFGVSHRQQASVVGVANFLPSVAGLLLDKEIRIISQALDQPKRPLVAIIGGAKADDKLKLISKLLAKADYCLVGGGVANTFFKAQGYQLGKSMVASQAVEQAKKLLQPAKFRAKIILPADVVLGKQTGKFGGVVSSDKIRGDWQALDIGPKTEAEFGWLIAKAKTIIWNGPMGVFEQKEFAHGTEFVYYSIAQNRQSLSIVGGGETLAALSKKEYLEEIDHVSTGGGAMLEFIEKGSLPGIACLDNK